MTGTLAHNAGQRRYFEERFKPRMLPADTPYLNRQVDEALRAARVKAGDAVLEVGCGMGRYTFLLAGRGLKVEGLDLTPGLLARLAEFDGGRYGVPLHEGDVADPPPGLEGRFAGIVGFFMLHHVHDLARCLAGCARLLAPGGRLAFVEPNPWNPLYYVQILATPGMTWEGDKGILRMRESLVLAAMREARIAEPAAARFGFLPPFLANRPWGPRAERLLESLAPRALLPFQLFSGLKA